MDHDEFLKILLVLIKNNDVWEFMSEITTYGNRRRWANLPEKNIILKSISKDPTWSYYYASWVLMKPWPEGEESISKDSEVAYLYAANVIKGRWPMGETAIYSDPYGSGLYRTLIGKTKHDHHDE